jgi:uncharacterized protein
MTTAVAPPFKSPAIPAALEPQTRISFRCAPGIACFNACCKQADVTLTPYDILRLKRRLGLDSTDFLRDYTVPFELDADGLPGVKLKTRDDGTCLQLAEETGCGVYADRPTVCRYYPLALLALREKGAAQAQERYSLVREDHCLGHLEPREISVADYRTEQGCPEYDDHNRPWYELLLKKRSAGPAVGRPPPASLQLFFLASYDLDRFRRFVLSDAFRGTYVLPEGLMATLGEDDEALLDFACRFLRQVLFGERSLEEAADAWERRVAQRQGVWEARREAAVAQRLADEDAKYGADTGCEAACGDR